MTPAGLLGLRIDAATPSPRRENLVRLAQSVPFEGGAFPANVAGSRFPQDRQGAARGHLPHASWEVSDWASRAACFARR
jgi:hypothetical protein